MNRSGMLILMLFLVAGSTEAMFVRLSESELLEQSELIVVGELIGRSSVNAGEGRAPLVLGVIRVEETLKGGSGVSVAFLALPGGGLAASTDLQYRDGQQGLWYLRLRREGEAGIYAADHPQRFVPMAEAAAQIEALKPR